jgi:hypothetical protein
MPASKKGRGKLSFTAVLPTSPGRDDRRQQDVMGPTKLKQLQNGFFILVIGCAIADADSDTLGRDFQDGCHVE